MRAALVIAVVLGSAGLARGDRAPNVVVVIDRSLPAAKLAAITGALADAARSWPADDRLGVVLAGPQPAVDVPLAPAQKARIRGVRTAARGDLLAAIKLAGTQLAGVPTAYRRILVVSDGNELLPIGTAARDEARRGIHVSALGYQSLNRVTLRDLAAGGQGRLFLADDARALATTFADLGRPVPDGDPVERQDMALVVVIDRSASLQGPAFEAAKETARVTAEVLAPDDYIAVVGFASEATDLVPAQRAGNRMRISNEIATLQTGGGTDLVSGLKRASEILAGINAKVKYVLFISDGDAPMDGVVELVKDMHAARVNFGVVGVAHADRANLTAIADAAEGRLYMVDDIGSLPKIFMRETDAAPQLW